MNGPAGNKERPQEGNKGLVYVIHATGTNRVKIGFSFDPAKRLAELQTGSPFPLTLIGTCEGSFSLECRMHERLKDYRRTGEWFEFGPQEALDLLQQLSAAKDEGEYSIDELPDRILQALHWVRALQANGDPEVVKTARRIEALLNPVPAVLAAAAEQLAEVA